MTRHISVALAVAGFLVWGPASCAAEPSTSTEKLALQDSGLAVGGDVEKSATKVVEYAISEAELAAAAEACEQAQGIPVEGSDACAFLIEKAANPDIRRCSPVDICVRIFAVEHSDLDAAGYVEVTDRRGADSLCDSDPEEVCLRVGVTEQAVDELAAVTETTPTPSPAETSEGSSPTETPTGSTTPSAEPTSSATP